MLSHDNADLLFHLRNDMSVDDVEGLGLAGLSEARARAEQYAVDMTAASVLEQRKINFGHRIEVANDSGEIVHTVRFGEVIEIVSEELDRR